MMATFKSPRQAIRAFCKGCGSGDSNGGSWLNQIENCPITNCELYDLRPITAQTRRLRRESELALLAPAERELLEIRGQIARENMLNVRNSLAITHAH